MADFLIGSTQGMNYIANNMGAPQILQGTPQYNVEVSEGQNPPGEFYPAHYLPATLSENRIQGSAYVLTPGKVVSLDSNKRLIPAYLGYETTLASSGRSIAYTAIDEQFGTRVPGTNPVPAFAGQKVADLMVSAGLSATVPVGIMRYSALAAPGTDPSNPATFFKHAYDTGGARAFSRWCYIQVPVVEINERCEAIPTNSTSFRIGLYTDVTSGRPNVKLYTSNTTPGTEISLTYYASPNLMTPVSGTPTQFSSIGRTLIFNGPTPAGAVARYTPTLQTPFTCLKVDYGTGKVVGATGGNGITQIAGGSLLGDLVTYDINSNFVQYASQSTEKVGRILDWKLGTNDDLKLVRTYFRDQGLWQEAPGSATDGRNTQLSIVNAPTYIARIAVNFNGLNF